MSWKHIPHTRCFKPLFGTMNPHGSIWACDVCGKRWMVDKTPTPEGERRVRWVDASMGATVLRIADDYRANLSKEPADVARRELAVARLWFDHHLNGVYADLGLERTR